MTTRQSYQKQLFFISAVYNWGAAILFMALYYLSHDLLVMLIKVPEQTLWFFISMAAVFLFGVGYYFISQDVRRNRDIIKLGCVGKAIFFLLFLAYWQKGDITVVAFSLACGDLLFSILFTQVLYSLKKTS